MASRRNVGQVCNLRPIFNRPGAGPEKFPWRFDQPGIHRIHLDVCRDPLKLRPISNQPIIAFNLPKRLPSKAKYPVRLPRCVALDRMSHLGDLHLWGYQEVHVVRHDYERMKVVVAQTLLPITKRVCHHVCDLRHPKVQRALTGVVEHSVHRQERLSRIRGFRKAAAWWDAAIESPSQKDGFAYRMEMRQPTDVGIAHKRGVEIRQENSLKTNRPITNRPQVANLPYIGAGCKPALHDGGLQ